jgi:hypothetical protein
VQSGGGVVNRRGRCSARTLELIDAEGTASARRTAACHSERAKHLTRHSERAQRVEESLCSASRTENRELHCTRRRRETERVGLGLDVAWMPLGSAGVLNYLSRGGAEDAEHCSPGRDARARVRLLSIQNPKEESRGRHSAGRSAGTFSVLSVPPRLRVRSVSETRCRRDGSTRRGPRFLDFALRAPLGMTGAAQRCALRSE